MNLPVSSVKLRFRAPDGSDDLAILEATGSAVERALAILPRLVEVVGPVDQSVPMDTHEFWAALTVTDFETALLGLRRFLFGDTVACMFRDNSHDCRERLEVEFSITAFLADARPTAQPEVERAEGDPPWFHLSGKRKQKVRFRLPSVEDQVAVLGEPEAAVILARRCIDSPDLKPRTLAHVEQVMEGMAPQVSRPLTGQCPECDQSVTVPLHVSRLVMDELQYAAAGVHGEIDAIAAAYHWREDDILALPQRRRHAYAEMIRRRERSTQ